MFGWYADSSSTQRKTFWACFAGWALDTMDVQIFALVIPSLLAIWHLSKSEVGWLAAIPLFFASLGGWIAGLLADRYGRVKILQLTVLWFSLFTLLVALCSSFEQLMVVRALQGLGVGGEWSVGAVLMAEVIGRRDRGKATAAVQSGWSVGYALAVLLYAFLFQLFPEADAWRYLFVAGFLPALLVLFIRRGVQEPEIARETRASAQSREPLFAIFRPGLLQTTVLGTLLGVGSHSGKATLSAFLPTYLKTERHLDVLNTSSFLAVFIVGSFLGYFASGYLSDRIGRRMSFCVAAVTCIIVLILYLFLPFSNGQILWLGFPLGFFSSGIPANMGSALAEIFPTSLRGSGQGFCYNAGRIISSFSTVMVGTLGDRFGLGVALGALAITAYGIVIVAASLLPETAGRALVAGSEIEI